MAPRGSYNMSYDSFSEVIRKRRERTVNINGCCVTHGTLCRVNRDWSGASSSFASYAYVDYLSYSKATAWVQFLWEHHKNWKGEYVSPKVSYPDTKCRAVPTYTLVPLSPLEQLAAQAEV